MSRLWHRLRVRWSMPNGFRDVLRISLPLIVSMCSHTVMLFTDRLFLGRYSMDALAAATPAGLTAFTFACFFGGIATFTNTFVAQYVGAGQARRVGLALWQALYFAASAGVVLAAMAWLGEPIFAFAGHPLDVRRLEVVYFEILMWGAGLTLLHDVLGCFYSGRGLTAPIMLVNLLGMALNVPLDYALIFGRWGLPELGVAGSALATVASHGVMLVAYALLVFRKQHETAFGVWRERRFDPDLFRRLLRFGAPAGAQIFVDLLAFTFFTLMVGRLGRDALAATNLAFALNVMAFMPMLGFTIAVGTLVGQAVGAGRPEQAETATSSALLLTTAYMWTVALLFVIAPGPFCEIFRSPGADAAAFDSVKNVAMVLLRFVALYSVLDVYNVIYSGALKGAGDTRYIGWTIFILSLGVMIAPLYLAVAVFGVGLYVAWLFPTLYVCLLAVLFRRRYRQGRWKHLRVIEPHLLSPEPAAPVPGFPGAGG
jgi:MATE family multidrug resistance protein